MIKWFKVRIKLSTSSFQVWVKPLYIGINSIPGLKVGGEILG